MKLDKLLKEIETVAAVGRQDAEVTGVACDSRQVRPGSVFVAAAGHTLDGRQFIEEAVSRGAVAIVSEQEPRARREVCAVQVRSARRAVGELASAYHQHPASKLQVVGITGTNGKTTTAFLVRDLLEAAGRETGLIGTVEYRFASRVIPASRTTPDAPLLHSLLGQMVSAGCRSVAMEVSSHALDQDRAAGVDFDVAVFTNVTRDHLDYHQTVERYFEAKLKLFTALGRGRKAATAAVNLDCPWGRRIAGLSGLAAPVLTYGLHAEAAVRAESVELAASGSRFDLCTPWGRASVRTRLLGRFNVSNALAAITACGVLGVPLDSACAALERASRVPGRMEEVPTRAGYQVFVDYAHTDDALENVLKTLREIVRGRIIVVFGCGGNRDVTKRPAMGRVAAQFADHTIITSDNPRKEDPAAIIAQIQEGFGAGGRCDVVVDRGEAIHAALAMARRDDILLIAGKGHETFQEFANTTVPFDDREVVRKALEAGR